MGITLAHNFVSAKGNGTDLTLIQPSNWNDQHVIKMDSGNLIGRQSAGNGAVEQIPLTAFMATLLAAVDAPTLAGLIGLATTGDAKLTLKIVADPGWVMMNDGTIGDALSPASCRANADCLNLFTLIYNVVSDAGAPVLTGGGVPSTRAALGSAAAAWAAHSLVTLPKQLGRAFVGAGAGAGLTNRPLGTNFGEESHALSAAENGPHFHGITLHDPGHSHSAFVTIGQLLTTGNGTGGIGGSNNAGVTGTSSTGITISDATNGAGNSATSGSGTPHNNTQASSAWNVMVKL